jgi:L-lactate dehydrogenase complex protein LldG
MNRRPSSRDEILGKLKQALPWPKAEASSHRPEGEGALADRAALIELFIAKATAAGAVVKRVEGIPDAARQVVSFMSQDGLSSAILSGEQIVGTTGIQAALKEAGIEAITIPSDPASHKEACFRAGAGITGASYAIAETGSLAMVFNRQNPRLVSHAPFCHIAMLWAKDVLPDTETLFERLSDGGISPSAMALITGPSMTADIALSVIRGIHGPGRLYIVVIE